MPRHSSVLIVATLLALVAPSALRAGVEISFPLGERYRVGRYLPVRVVASDLGNAVVRIEAAGAVPTEIAPTGGRVDAVVPLLAVTTLGEVTWSAGRNRGSVTQRLRPLADDERLVGVTTAPSDAALAAELFRGMKLEFVALALTDPLPGPDVAWSALDGVCLDESAAARVTDMKLAMLLFGGATVAVRSDASPAVPWPWQQVGGWWAARPTLSGPQDLIRPEAYLPTRAWNPGWPAGIRRTLALVLVVFTIVAIGVSLWQSRYATHALVAVSIAGVACIAVWRSGAISVRNAIGMVVINDGQWQQHDTWIYYRGLARDTHRPQVALILTRPVFASRLHFEHADVTLEAGAGAIPALRFRLEQGQTLALLSRALFKSDVFETPAFSRSDASPLHIIAERLYLQHHGRIAGSSRAGAVRPASPYLDVWPAVYVERSPVTRGQD